MTCSSFLLGHWPSLLLGVAAAALTASTVTLAVNLAAANAEVDRLSQAAAGGASSAATTTTTIGTTSSTSATSASATTVTTASESQATTSPQPDVTTDTPVNGWEGTYRLPEDVQPLHYELLLNPQLEEATFVGAVSITVQTQRARGWLAVHRKGLNITESRMIRVLDSAEVPLLEPVDYTEGEMWVLQPRYGQILAGTYLLNFIFFGSLTDSIVGFYRSTYSQDGSRR